MAKAELLEGCLSVAQEEVGTLKEALQKERLEKTQREGAVQELQRKVKGLEDHQKGLEVLLRDKQDTEVENERKLKSLRQRAYRATEKVL
jgi:predicted RNase H-like nuclease (RuvC/YqgF family)